MPALPISDSPNISSLDSLIKVNLCTGYFYIDVTPSVWIGTGYNEVQGASVQITNPVGVIIDSYPTSGFDIYPPMTSIYSFAIPQIAGVYGYGTYSISVRLTDEDGDTYTVTKSVNICPPDPNNKNKNLGCLNATIKGNCNSGKVVIILNQPPNYKGTQFTSQVNDLTLEYPTASGLPVYDTTLGAFSVQLYEGIYKLSGTVCVLYTYTDNIFYYINYKVKCEKDIKCIIDECCVFAKLQELNLRITTDCTQAQKDETASIGVQAIFLLKTAELAANCGEDPSDFISDLEKLLGCVCTCNCNEGTPIIGNSAEAGYIYRGLVSQSGTSIPTDIPSSINVVTITWTRTSAGLYVGTLVGGYTPLTASNTFVVYNFTSQALIEVTYNSENSISVKTSDFSTGLPTDGLLNNMSLEISILG